MRGASILGLAAGAVLAFAAGAAAQSESEGPLMPADVKFKRMPNFGATAFYFPSNARMKRIEGRATVICRVQPDGGLGDCAVTAEAPDGEGFGEATRRLAGEEIVIEKKARDGSPTAGRLFQFTRIFALPGAAGTKQTMPLDLGEVGEDGLRRRWIQSRNACVRSVLSQGDQQLPGR